MNVTGRLHYMLVENSSDGQVISKYLIEVSNRTATTADELLLRMFHSDHKELFLIPDSMVKNYHQIWKLQLMKLIILLMLLVNFMCMIRLNIIMQNILD